MNRTKTLVLVFWLIVGSLQAQVSTNETIKQHDFETDSLIDIQVTKTIVSDTTFVGEGNKLYIQITKPQIRIEPYISESIPMITSDDVTKKALGNLIMPSTKPNRTGVEVSPIFSVHDEFQVNDFSSQLASSININDLRSHLTVIASDRMQGRETGTPGQKLAAIYLDSMFTDLDLTKTAEDSLRYYQKVSLISEEWNKISLRVNDQSFRFQKDFYCFHKSNKNRPSTRRDEVLFLGYGIDDEKYNDYYGVDVKDKIILIYKGEPQAKDGSSYITGTDELSDWSLNWDKKLMAAKRRGVRTVLLIEKHLDFYVNRYEYYLNRPHLRLAGKDQARKFANSLYITPEVAKEIIGKQFEKVLKARQSITATGQPQNLTLACKISIRQDETNTPIYSENMLGYIEGSDPYLKNETVIVMAHYDHLGMQGEKIYPGADDNGSGVAAMLEVAEAFTIAKKVGYGPRRSVLFLATTGEEQGSLGSEYYAEEPRLSLNNTVAVMNVSMIGRVDANHEDNPNYVYIIGSDRLSSDLHTINEKVNKNYTQLDLDYKYNDVNDPNRFYYKADHYHFASKGIPSIFYFNGLHRDYHRISDTVDKINFDKLERNARLIFLTAWEVSNLTKKPKVDNLFRDSKVESSIDE